MIKRMYISAIRFAGILVLIINVAYAQKLPVQTTIQVLPPYTTDYASFVSPVNGKLRTTVVLTDLQEPSVDVRFRISIEGAGIRIQTPASFRPSSAVTLLPGVASVVEGSMWTEYLEPQNLEFSGIDRQQFINDGRFPEGMYTFSVVALDYVTGKELSRVSNTIAWLKLNDEPTIISPQMASVQPITGPQNILFQWQLNTPVNTGTPFTPVYKLFLYELTVEDADPIYAMENGQTMLVYESDELYSTSLNYTVANPALDAGKVYMFRVQAIDPTGQNEFRNDGFSPNSYFYYGYPMGGVIEPLAPEDRYAFTKADPQRFEFSAPSKLTNNQQFTYTLKIVSIEDENDDPADAIEFNSNWHTQLSSPTSSRDNYGLDVNKKFDKDQWYAWQITAKTGEQEIAASEPRIFQGPPLIESFKAGIHTVIVSNLSNNDLTNLSGEGLIKISETDTDSTMTKIVFEGLNIKQSGGRYALESGEIEYMFDEQVVLELTARQKGNAASYFYAEGIKLNKKEMQVYGHVEYPFPHPAQGSGSELPAIVTQGKWVNFDDYAPFGEFNLTDENQFDLVDPFGFRMELRESSQIQVFYDKYELQLDGSVLVNEKVVSVDGNRVELPFRRATQLYHIEETGSKAVEDILIAPHVNAYFNSADYVLDFSEEKSPRGIEEDEWKGAHFNRYELTIAKNADKSRQFLIRKDLEYELNQNTGRDLIARIDGYGLDFYWEQDLRSDDIAWFNKFPAKVDQLQFNIENSAVQESGWTGTIQIPVISDTEEMAFVMPMTKAGFGDGYLTESLDNRTFIFSPYGGENRADITIRRAIFEDNDHLNLTADVEIPELEAKIAGVKNLNLYGDYNIGFDQPGGTLVLSTRADGRYKTYDIQITKLGASLSRGNYVFSYETEILMDEGFSGQDGEPPVLNFYGVAEASDEVAAASSGADVTPQTVIPTFSEERNPKEMQVDELEIEFTSAVVDYKGVIRVARNDPEWGTVFRGEVSGTQKLPSPISIGGSMMYGKKDFSYFYMDAYYVDSEGMGVTIVPGILNMVGCEGWIFSNMNVVDDVLVLDGNNDLGFNLFVQLIDASAKGGAFQMDGLMEFRSGNGDIKVVNDISLLNSNVRSSSSSGAIKQKIAEEVSKEVLSQTMDALGGFDETINVAGVDLRVKLSEADGLLGMSTGGNSVSVFGDISGTPSVGFDFESGPVGLALKAGMNKTASMKFDAGSFTAKMFYEGSGNKFQMDGGDFKMSAGLNNSTKLGSMDLNVGSLKSYTQANLESKAGEFAFESGDVNLKMSSDMSNKAGEFLADFGSSSILARGDMSKKQGQLNVDLERLETDFGFDQVNQSAFTNFGNSDFGGEVVINKSEKTTDFSGYVGDNSFKLKGDQNNGGELAVDIDGVEARSWVSNTGSSGLEFAADDFAIRGAIDKAKSTGELLYQQGDFKIGGAKTADGGSVDLQIDGNTFKGEVAKDLYRLDMDVQGVRMAAIDSKDSTALLVGAGGQTFAIGGDPAKHRGFVNWSNGGDRIFVKADQPNKSGKVDFSLGGVGIGAEMMDGYQSASFNKDGLSFGGAISADSARIHLTENSNRYVIQVSETGNNLLNIENDMIDLLIAANNSEQSGEFHVGLSDYDLSAGMSQDQLDLGFLDKANQSSIVAMANKAAQKASFELGIDGLKMAAHGDMSARSGRFDFTNGDLSVLAESSMTEQVGNMKIVQGDLSFGAVSDAVNGISEINLNLAADKELSALIDQVSGAAQLNLNFGTNLSKFSLENDGKIYLNTALGDNTIFIDADKSKGGKIGFGLGSDKIASWVYASGLAGLELKQGSLAMMMEANSADHISSLSYDDGNLSFAASANEPEQTGSLNLGFDGYKAYGAYTSELQEVSFTKDALELSALSGADSTSLRMKEGEQLLEIGGDPGEQNGVVRLQKGNDQIFVAVDVPQSYGRLDYAVGSTMLKGLVSSTEKSGYFKTDGLEMATLSTSDSLGASFLVSHVDLKLGVNPVSGDQFISAQSADFGTSILTSNEGTDAAFSLNVMGEQIKTAVASSGVSLSYSGSIDFETTLSPGGISQLDFSGADQLARVQLGSPSIPHAIAFSLGANSLSAQINEAGDAGSASIELDGKRAKTSFGANGQLAVLGSGADSISIEHLGDGVGAFNMSVDDAAVKLHANPNDGKGALSVSNGTHTFSLDANMKDQTGSFSFKNPGFAASGRYKNGGGNFLAQSATDFIRTQINHQDISAAMGFDSDSVRIAFTGSDVAEIDLAYQSMTLSSSLELNTLDNELAVKLPNTDWAFKTSLSGDDFSLDVEGNAGVTLGLGYQLSTGKPSLHLEQSDLAIDLKEEATVQYQNFGLTLTQDLSLKLSLPDFSLDIPALQTLNAFTMDDLSRMMINGAYLSPEMPNADYSAYSEEAKTGLINWAKAGVPVVLELAKDYLIIKINETQSLKYSAAGWEVSIPEAYGLKMIVDAQYNWQQLAFEVPEFMDFDITPEEIKTVRSGAQFLTVSKDQMSIALDQVAMKVTSNLFELALPDQKRLLVDAGNVTLEMAEVKTRLIDQNRISLDYADQFGIALSPQGLSFDIDDIDVNLNEGLRSLHLESGSKVLSFDQENLKAQYEDYLLTLDKTKINAAVAQDYLSLGFDGNIAASVGDVTMDVKPEERMSLTTPDYSAGINVEGLVAEVQDLKVSLSKEQQLKVAGLGGHELNLTNRSFDYAGDDLSVGFATGETVKFEGFGFEVDAVDASGLSVRYQDYALIVAQDGASKLSFGSDNYLDLSADNFTAKYEDFTVALGGESLLNFNSQYGGFELKESDFSLTKDGYKLAVDTDKNLSLTGPDLNFDLDPENYGITYADYTVAVSPEKIISLASSDLNLSTDKLDISLEDYNVKMNLETPGNYSTSISKGETAALEINQNGTGSAKFEDFVLAFDEDNQVTVGYHDLQFAGSIEGMRVDYNDYRLSLGKEKLLSFNMPDLELTFAESGMDFSYQDYQIGFTEEKIFGSVDDLYVGIGFTDYMFDLKGLGAHHLNLSYEGVEYNWDNNLSVAFGIGKNVKFSGYDMDFELDPSAGFDLDYDQFGVALSADKALTFQLDDAQNTIEISPELFRLKYDNVDLGFGANRDLWFFNDPYSFELSEDALALTYDDMALGMASSGGFSFRKGSEMDVKVSETALNFDLPDYGIRIDEGVLSLKTLSYELNTEELMIGVGEYDFGLTFIDDVPAIRLTNRNTVDLSVDAEMMSRIKLHEVTLGASPESFSFGYENDFNVSASTERFDFQLDDYKMRVSTDTLVSFNEGSLNFMVLLNDGTGTIKDFRPGIYAGIGDYYSVVTSDGLSFYQGLSERKRAFSIDKRFKFIYDEYELTRFTAEVSKETGYDGKISLNMPDFGYGGAVGFLTGDEISVDLKTPVSGLENLSVRTNGQGEIEGMIDGGVDEIAGDINVSQLDGYMKYGGSAGIKVSGEYLNDLLGFDMSGTQEGEFLEESKDINVSEAKYIGNITDAAGGFFRGKSEMMINGSELVIKGNVSADQIIKIDGAFDFTANKDHWHMYLGTKSNPISVSTYVGSMKGFLHVSDEELEVGFRNEYRLGGKVDLTSAGTGFKFGAEAWYYMGGEFAAGYTWSNGMISSIQFKKLRIEAGAGFHLEGEGCFSGACKGFSLASVRLEGSVEGYVEELRLEGELSGSARALGRNIGSFSINPSIEL